MNLDSDLETSVNLSDIRRKNELQAKDVGLAAALWSSMTTPAGAVISSVFLSNAAECYNCAGSVEPGNSAKTYYEDAAISAGIALAPLLLSSLVLAVFLHVRRNYLSNAVQAYRDGLASST